MIAKLFDGIRRINSAVSFASVNPIRDTLPKNRQHGPYCFRIHGMITHKINTALFPSGNDPSWGQLYLIDQSEATDIRLKNNPTIERHLLEVIGNIIRKESPYAEAYNMMFDEYKKQEQIAVATNSNMPNIAFKFSGKKREHDVRYNIPTSLNEVCAVFVPGADGEIPETYLAIFPKTGNKNDIKILKSTDENTDALCYQLFFVKGSFGWNPNLQQFNSKTRVSRAQFVSYRISVRDLKDTNEFNPILYGRKLFHQYCVDQAVRIEKDRMDFVVFNQKQMCSDRYNNVTELMNKKAIEEDLPLGRKIILPSSIQGTPRWQNEQYQDAMTIVSRMHGSDLFVTMTCNPNWPEIVDNLFPGQVSTFRPELITRSFNIRKNALIDDIVKGGIFGRHIGHVDVIEFQMRGLPHMHLIMSLHSDDKLRYPCDIDKIIMAQIPDRAVHPELYDIVVRNMVHGPCGHYNPNAPCMENGKCTKHYPKEFLEVTTLNEDGYPNYARPNNGRTITKGAFQLDNRWIVPYSPYLLLRYNCHINVERVFDIKSVKYLYKYIYKGPDRVELEMKEKIDHDEVKRYIDGRAVTAPDACWKIFRFPIQEKSHAVIHLPVHLEGQQPVYWEEEWDEEQIKEAMNKKKMLQAYFDLNNPESDHYDPTAADYFYFQIPEHFTWQNGYWKARVKSMDVLGRMYWIDPSHSEEFHERLLLTRLKGEEAQSFISLRSVNGIDCGSYKKACLARGLIKDDTEWINCMEDAVNRHMPSQLRTLLARIFAHCNPVNCFDLWNKFKKHLSEDYLKNNPKNQAEKLAYIDFVKRLIMEGKTLNDFPDMPECSDVSIQDDINAQKELEQAYSEYAMLNTDQRNIIDAILRLVDIPSPDPHNVNDIGTKESNAIFIDGPGGTGKTTVYKVVNHFLKGYGKKVENMAFMGIAATILPAGRTIHNRFGLPVPLHSDSNSSIGPNSKAWNELKATEVFIVDEGSMVPRHVAKIFNNLLQQIMENDKLFGGKIFLFGGDFRQILPIQKHATRSQLCDLTLKGSDLWKYFNVYKLTENMRVNKSAERIKGMLFDDWLLKVGNGELNDEDDYIELPEEIISKESLEDVVFRDTILKKDWKALENRAILAPLNAEVDMSNKKVLNMLPGDDKIYYSIDEAKNEQEGGMDEKLLLNEYLHTLSPPSLPLHELRLKKHAIVMLLRNLNIKDSLCNGTRLELINMHKHYLECKILHGQRTGEIELIPRITLNLDKYYPFVLMRHQFPVKLSFCMTINKSQGQTLDFVGIKLLTDLFTHGMFYTGVSRVRGWRKLQIELHPENKSKRVKNVVYKELLD